MGNGVPFCWPIKCCISINELIIYLRGLLGILVALQGRQAGSVYYHMYDVMKSLKNNPEKLKKQTCNFLYSTWPV